MRGCCIQQNRINVVQSPDNQRITEKFGPPLKEHGEGLVCDLCKRFNLPIPHWKRQFDVFNEKSGFVCENCMVRFDDCLRPSVDYKGDPSYVSNLLFKMSLYYEKKPVIEAYSTMTSVDTYQTMCLKGLTVASRLLMSGI